ncbi:MAG: methyl-accepting chemotaxis protein [Magnetococcus sp. XQGC-1]
MRALNTPTITTRLAVGSGLLGCLFLGGVALHLGTLTDTLATPREQLPVGQLHSKMQAARESSHLFLLHKKPDQIEAVTQSLTELQQITDTLLHAQPDAATARLLHTLRPLAESHLAAFLDLAKEETDKGLRPHSGLQGKLRATAETLEQQIAPYNLDELQRNLLKMRQTEQAYQLTNELKYLAILEKNLRQTSNAACASALPAPVKEALLAGLDQYWTAFKSFLQQSLENAEASPDRFRSIALEMETLLNARHIPGVEQLYLAIRQDEQAYQLYKETNKRDGMVQKLEALQQAIAASPIPNEEKAALTEAATTYQATFLALLAKEEAVNERVEKMQASAESMEPILAAILLRDREERDAALATARQQAHIALGLSGLLLLCGLLLARQSRRLIAEESPEPQQPLSSELALAQQQHADTTRACAHSMAQQATAMAETATALGEMLPRIRQQSDDLHALETIAQASARGSVTAATAITQTVTSMEEIARNISLIEELARQTDLLALHAAAEPPKAGKRGKKLAAMVVELHALAARAQHGAREIAAPSATGVVQAEEAGKRVAQLLPEMEKMARQARRLAAANREEMQQMEQNRQQISRAAETLSEAAERVHNRESLS